jgi:hypothetical protein
MSSVAARPSRVATNTACRSGLSGWCGSEAIEESRPWSGFWAAPTISPAPPDLHPDLPRRFSAATRTGIRRKMRASQRPTPLLTPQQSDYRRFSTATLPLPCTDQCPFAPCDALPNAGAGKRRSRPTEQTCSTSLLTLHDSHVFCKAAGGRCCVSLFRRTFFSSFLFHRPYRPLRASGYDFLLNSVSTLR